MANSSEQEATKPAKHRFSLRMRLFFGFVLLMTYPLGGLYLTNKETERIAQLTPEQRAAEIKQSYQRQVEWTAAKTQREFICQVKNACSKYVGARQDCAVAGNFNTCLEVKMGEVAARLVQYCNTEGGLKLPPDNMPSYLDCLLGK